jgi:P-aminobenzoate N-oxygenase AurF
MSSRKSQSTPAPWMFDPVDSTDYFAVIAPERYGKRADLFDPLISETHQHFWDPSDPAYIDFDTPFDLENRTVLPMELVPELRTAVADRLDEKQRIAFANQSARWWISSVLHGEQGALSLSASLCHVFDNIGAVEYAANQAREEARHVTAFARYIKARWGAPLPASRTLGTLLGGIIASSEVYQKIVGMQLLVEGLGMGIFATFHSKANDPLLVRLSQLVMTDEAFHHKFGKLWSKAAVPAMTAEERDRAEDWAAQCFQALMFNMMHAREKQAVYRQFGMDWEWVRDAMKESYTSASRREEMRDSTNVFRVLTKTLLNAGIITSRTRDVYAAWVDLKELSEEDEGLIAEPIAESGLALLREINSTRPVRRKAAPAAAE